MMNRVAGMATLHLVDEATAGKAEAIIVATGATESGVRLLPGAQSLDAELDGGLSAALAAIEATGRADEVCKIPTLGRTGVPLIVATGTGRGADPESVRRAVGAAMRGLSRVRRVAVAIGDGSDVELIGAVAEGALLGSYRFTRFKSGAEPSALRRVDIVSAQPSDRAARAALTRAAVIAEAVNNARDLVNTPANVLNPPAFADYARERGQAAGLQVEVLDERALKRGRFGAILAVGGGSATPPRLVRLRWSPPKPVARIALVGKGITFDSGGLDIKHQLMAEMKSDMGGAAAMVEAVAAAAALKLPVEVIATVPMAENAVSGTSYRPSDVITARNGKTIEVANTDAEGRLILADAISRACEDGPDYLIEAATLTGGQMVALGDEVAGVMGSEQFRDLVVGAGTRAGELMWAMPLGAHLRPQLASPVADIKNVTGERWASMLMAGTFLADFVTDGVQWAHIDLAGPAFRKSARGYDQTGATGFGVRAVLATLTELAAG